ncbi:MAG TPA: maltose alpha-D-glucosyltransferase [Actinomycetota bacterium]|nr:maltose alpha-D-glucosyltransferase [Actinomycetota bacterium]
MSRRPPAAIAPQPIVSDPLWYHDAVLYELHVRAFQDSDGDGSGDFRGLTQRLDYLADLGVTAIWLLPFYPSPLRDDGYDTADYLSVHPQYGTLRDFRGFLRAAHARGLRVITELVLNHTSDQHPWFQRSRRAAPDSPERDFYVWNDTTEKYREARIIFKDFESSNWAFDHDVGAYYWHRFYSHQPDLNFDSPRVRRAMLNVVDFWLDMGVDGLRLDAVPYLFERRGTNCENLPETHAFLKELREHVDARYEGRMLLAEANQWPEDAVAYFGDGDECHMAFHFPLMPRMFMSLRMEDRFPLVDILDQTPPIPDGARWALFLRNHDELTLEMVTDEERDYMYRVYAEDPQARINLGIRRRLAPLLGNDRRTIEVINGLLFSLPGTPVIYYGDEIGMGDNIYLGDRNGVRTPMQWSSDRNAGFSRANPQQLYLPVVIGSEYHYESLNVEAQQDNPRSLLWWMKRLIALRKRHLALSRGSLEFLFPDNRKILVFLREHEGERILVVVNLARSVQYAELDLSRFKELVPHELFGGTVFPPIGDLPYFLTLGPYSFYWFRLEPQTVEAELTAPRKPPALDVVGSWQNVFSKRNRVALEEVLPGFLRRARWFGGKARRIKSVEIGETVPVSGNGTRLAAVIAIVTVDYVEGDPETYVLPLGCATPERTAELLEYNPRAVVARLRMRDGERALHDAIGEPELPSLLLEAVRRRRRLGSDGLRLEANPTKAFRRLAGPPEELGEPRPLLAEQSNTSVVFGDRLVLKLYRRIEQGLNPDLELGRFLTDRAGFEHIAPVAGGLELRRGPGQPTTIGIIHGFVPNEGDAWSYATDRARDYLESALAHAAGRPELDVPALTLFDVVDDGPPELAVQTMGEFLESARVLGQRTAEMHRALASDPEDPAFSPERVTALYQRSLYQSLRAAANGTFQLLRSRPSMPGADLVLGVQDAVLDGFRSVLDIRITGSRLRIHGDFHLGQVLYTGRDFVIIDFEGEPARPLGERRIKRMPLVDVSRMVRSFHYAVNSVARQGDLVEPERAAPIAPWVRLWYVSAAGAFLRSYLEEVKGAPFHPQTREETRVLLQIFLLEKALYELAYEANNRPDWLPIPATGVLELLETPA